MCDNVELIAASQVNAFAGPPAGIEFKSNAGFKTATRSSAGLYELELDCKHHRHEIVVNVTLNNTVAAKVVASLPSEGNIQINCFDASNSPVDSPFFITVWRVK